MRYEAPRHERFHGMTRFHCSLVACLLAFIAGCGQPAAATIEAKAGFPIGVELNVEPNKAPPSNSKFDEDLFVAQKAPKKPAPPPVNVQPKVPDLRIAVTEAEQRQINQAIAKGVQYLKTSLAKSGDGDDGGHSIGRLAIGALALLECGVPADDAAITRTAKAVRASAPRLKDTYSLALAIMFLDRLNQPADRNLIRSFAARLVAGQNGRGGWTYDCPLLSQPDETTLLTMLEDLPPLTKIVSTPTPLPDPLPIEGPLTNPLTKDGPLLNPIKPKPGDPLLNPLEKNPKLLDPLRKDDPKLQNPLRKESANIDQPIMPESRAILPERVRGPGVDQPLPAALKNVPALNVNVGQAARISEKKETDDNSNTQFAIMGLWAARRHGVPMDRTLVLVERRFRSSQNTDGSWGYHAWDHKQADSMTCTGLLGMALALGMDLQLAGRNAGVATADPAVKKGFSYLASTIGKAPGANPMAKGKGKGQPKGKAGSLVGADARGDLYYLWSVERVAVSYSTATIGTKNWYPWGAAVILSHQQADGSWHDRHSGIPDTSFALLFLTRANLVRGLPRLAL